MAPLLEMWEDIMKANIVENYILIGRVKCILEDVITGEKTIKEYDNLVTNAGKVAIARRLANIGLLANEGAITYGATGTDATAPLVTDTILGTELARKLVASSSYNAGTRQCTIRTFFTTAESNGALKEFGLFAEDAGAGADSGTLFNHANIDITKDVTKTLTIEVIITIS